MSKPASIPGFYHAVGSMVDVCLMNDINDSALNRTSQASSQPHEQRHLSLLDALVDNVTAAFVSDAADREEINQYASGAIKTFGLFARGKLGMGVTLASHALDAASIDESAGMRLADAAMGVVKGYALKRTFGAIAESSIAIAPKAIGLGIGARFIDTALTRRNYFDNDGCFHLNLGLTTALNRSLDKNALQADLVAGVVAHGMGRAFNRATNGLVDRSPFWSTVVNGGSFGMVSGAHSEILRQKSLGSDPRDIDWSLIAYRSLLQGGVDGLASMGGGIQVDGRARALLSEKAAAVRDNLSNRMHNSLEGAGNLVDLIARRRPVLGLDLVGTGSSSPYTIGRHLFLEAGKAASSTGEASATVLQAKEILPSRETSSDCKQENRAQGKNEQIPADGSAREPLNVQGSSLDRVARDMSNFALRPFILDGRQYSSVEGFYQGLKFSDPLKRAEVGALHGSKAKYAGKKSDATSFEYEGKTYQLGSNEHHELIKRAIRAKLEQHPDLAQAFAETFPRTIIHDLGHPESANTKMPATVFCRILTELRQELVDSTRKNVDKSAGTRDPGGANGGELRWRQVSDILRSTTNENAHEFHNLEHYARAFESFPLRVSELIGAGHDSLALRLEDGNVLKISSRVPSPLMGKRHFDMPILSSGSFSLDGHQINYMVQPFGAPVSEIQFRSFYDTLARAGYRFIDGRPNQLGLYNGEVRLLDYWAVQRIRKFL